MASKVLWYGVKLVQKVNTANKKVINKACLLVVRDAKKLCPVDTGRLRSSITHEVEGTTGRVGSNVEYARAVEMGSEDPEFNRAPQPYLRPALHKNEKAILALFKKII